MNNVREIACAGPQPPRRPDIATLVRCHHASLSEFFRYKVKPQDVDDLMQRVWMGLLKSWPRTIDDERAYLFGIARHVLYRYYSESKRACSFDPLTTSLVDLNLPLSQRVRQRRRIAQLLADLREEPLELQLLFELRYLNGLAHRELAVIFEIPIGTVKSRLFHTKVRLGVTSKE